MTDQVIYSVIFVVNNNNYYGRRVSSYCIVKWLMAMHLFILWKCCGAFVIADIYEDDDNNYCAGSSTTNQNSPEQLTSNGYI